MTNNHSDTICDCSPSLDRYDVVLGGQVYRLAAMTVDGRMFHGSADALTQALRSSRSEGCDIFTRRQHHGPVSFVRALTTRVVVIAHHPAPMAPIQPSLGA